MDTQPATAEQHSPVSAMEDAVAVIDMNPPPHVEDAVAVDDTEATKRAAREAIRQGYSVAEAHITIVMSVDEAANRYAFNLERIITMATDVIECGESTMNWPAGRPLTTTTRKDKTAQDSAALQVQETTQHNVPSPPASSLDEQVGTTLVPPPPPVLSSLGTVVEYCVEETESEFNVHVEFWNVPGKEAEAWTTTLESSDDETSLSSSDDAVMTPLLDEDGIAGDDDAHYIVTHLATGTTTATSAPKTNAVSATILAPTDSVALDEEQKSSDEEVDEDYQSVHTSGDECSDEENDDGGMLRVDLILLCDWHCLIPKPAHFASEVARMAKDFKIAVCTSVWEPKAHASTFMDDPTKMRPFDAEATQWTVPYDRYRTDSVLVNPGDLLYASACSIMRAYCEAAPGTTLLFSRWDEAHFSVAGFCNGKPLARAPAIG